VDPEPVDRLILEPPVLGDAVDQKPIHWTPSFEQRRQLERADHFNAAAARRPFPRKMRKWMGFVG